MTLEVAITVDVEFSIAGAFDDPAHREPVAAPYVECPTPEGNGGLDFILETLEAHGLRGVFFVEALNTRCFGDEPMARFARAIHERGHDVELHAHPCWSVFARDDWRDQVRRATPVDSFERLDDAAIGAAIRHGIDAFQRWGVPFPTAFRAGNLQCDLRTYAWLERLGIPLASNVGIGVHRATERALHLAGGRHFIGKTLEVPVSSYPDVWLPGLVRWKTFTVVGTGEMEARQWLLHAARLGVGPVVVLTHPGEFVHHDRDGRSFRRNELARRRLQGLCRFLADHAPMFDVVTFAQRAAAWTRSAATPQPRWRASTLARAMRVIENRRGLPVHAS